MNNVIPQEETEQLRMFAMGRIAVGLAFLLLPGLALRGWIGKASGTARIIGRAFGARDLVMGVATIRALDSGDREQIRFWAQAGVVADGTDLAATWLGARHIPKRNVVLLTAMAGGASAVGARIAKSLA